MKAACRSCLLAALLAVPLAAASQSLPLLNFQPAFLFPESLQHPTSGIPYRLWAYMGDPALMPFDTDRSVYLMPYDGLASPTRMPRFFLRLEPSDSKMRLLDIFLAATNDRCMLAPSGSGSRPGRYNRVGRVFNIRHQLTSRVESELPQVGPAASICAVDQGWLSITFGKPAGDSVDMMVVAQDQAAVGVVAYLATLPVRNIGTAKRSGP